MNNETAVKPGDYVRIKGTVWDGFNGRVLLDKDDPRWPGWYVVSVFATPGSWSGFSWEMFFKDKHLVKQSPD